MFKAYTCTPTHLFYTIDVVNMCLNTALPNLVNPPVDPEEMKKMQEQMDGNDPQAMLKSFMGQKNDDDGDD